MQPKQFLTEHERKNWTILEAIRRNGPITKSDISQLTGINIVTVSNYVSDYLVKGLVLDKGLNSSTGGRKPELVELNNKFAFAVGVDLGTLNMATADMVAVLTDLAGNIIIKVKRNRPRESIDKLLDRSIGLISELMENSDIDKEEIKGLGVGMPGIVDERTGTVRDLSKTGGVGSYLSVQTQIEQEFGISTFMGSDAALAAFAERIMRLDPEVKNIVYLHSETSCGIIINGEIYRGATGSTGELGLNGLGKDDFIRTQKYPFLQPRRTELAILSHARDILSEGVKSEMNEIVAGKPEEITPEVVVKAAKNGDKLAMELIEDAGVTLGVWVAHLINLFNPEVVIIGGELARVGSLLLDPIRKIVNRYAFKETASAAKILPAQLGEDSVAVGAAGLVIREAFLQA